MTDTPASGCKPKLLYVDDERANLTAFRVLLRDRFDVLTAENARDAYELLKEHDIPLVVSDQRMPGMSGTELLSKVAIDFPDCARMILTGYSDIDAVIDGINRSQIYYYFKKPWNENEVRLTLENALEYVTTRRRLVESEQRFRSTFEQAGVGIAHLNADGTIIRVNSKLMEFLKTKEVELTGRSISSWFSVIGEEELASTSKGFAAMVLRETSVPTPHGDRWSRVALTANQPRRGGDAGNLILVVEDLTESKLAEANLAAVASEWQNTFDSVSDAIWILDKEQRIVRCNKSTELLFGVAASDIISKRCHEVAHDCPFSPESCPLTRMKQTLVREAMELPMGEKTYWVSVDPILDTSGKYNGAVHILSDITSRRQLEKERDQLEERLRQSQKLEAIGSLAGGVAHDFNNLLTPIMVYSEMIENRFPNDEFIRGKSQGIVKAAESARQLTSQLLTFSRKQVLEMTMCDFNEVIGSFLDILRRTIRENIQIDINLSHQRINVMADKGQLVQIVLNLVVNAQDAIADNGTVTIETAQIMVDNEVARLHPGMIPGKYALLTVTDNGSGMDDETLAHLFEPFYTTKQVGKGTGLGLSTVYGIVKQHEGFVDVCSSLGHGTVFRIFLPLRAIDEAVVEKTADVALNSQGCGGTILVVDDNDMIREMLVEILEESGYSVYSAGTPGEALKIADGMTGDISLLLTDVVMPEMNGMELYERLLLKYGDLKVMYISGYTSKFSIHGGVLEDGVNFLPKPFTVQELLERIQRLLQ